MLIIAVTTVHVAVMVDNAIPVEGGYGLHVFIAGQFVQAGFSYDFGYLRVGVLAFQLIPLFFQRVEDGFVVELTSQFQIVFVACYGVHVGKRFVHSSEFACQHFLERFFRQTSEIVDSPVG